MSSFLLVPSNLDNTETPTPQNLKPLVVHQRQPKATRQNHNLSNTTNTTTTTTAMKLTTIFTVLAAAFIGTDVVSAKNNYWTCMDKKNGRDAVDAINNFCKQKTDLHAPSTFASFGGISRNYELRVRGSCKPPQFIPRKYCYSQMFATCAKGDKYGEGFRKYGKNKCQEFSIKYKGN